jgi:hypothetical protein
VKRVHIPKSETETRPIGMPTVESKVLERAVVMLLEPVYEREFLDCSFGFRPGRSAHQALEAVRKAVMVTDGGGVLDVNVRKYFDTIPHHKLREVLSLRITARGHSGTHNGRSLAPVRKTLTGANQRWCWDISYLSTGEKGIYLFLYLVLDEYSRCLACRRSSTASARPHAAAELLSAGPVILSRDREKANFTGAETQCQPVAFRRKP